MYETLEKLTDSGLPEPRDTTFAIRSRWAYGLGYTVGRRADIREVATYFAQHPATSMEDSITTRFLSPDITIFVMICRDIIIITRRSCTYIV